MEKEKAEIYTNNALNLERNILYIVSYIILGMSKKMV